MAPGVACCMSAWRTCVYDFFGLLFAVFVLGNVFCPPPQQQEVERIRGCDCQEHPFRKELKTAARDFTVTDPLTLLWLLHVVTVHLAPYRPGTIGVWECVCFQENFSTPAMAHLQNPPPPTLSLAPPPHTQTSPVRTSTLPRSGRPLCVLLTCLLSTGASNQASRPPWITNAPTVGPQTAHCLSYGVFCLFLFWLHCHRGSLSKFWHLLVCAHVCVSVCIYGFTNVFFFFFFADTTQKHVLPLWLILQRTSASNSRARCRAL